MILCLCRTVKGTDDFPAPLNDKVLKIHLIRNPDLLSKDWAAVTKNMTGCEMKCGTCEDRGNEMIQWIREEEEVASVTASPMPLVAPA